MFKLIRITKELEGVLCTSLAKFNQSVPTEGLSAEEYEYQTGAAIDLLRAVRCSPYFEEKGGEIVQIQSTS